MKIYLIIIAFFTLCATATSKEDFCGRVTTFDAVCKYNGIVYILSANPCNTNSSVGLTVVHKLYSSVLHLNVTHDIRVPWRPISLLDIGLKLEMHHLPYPKLQDFRKQRLHVRLFLVSLKSDGNVTDDDPHTLLNVQFPMFPKVCEERDKSLGNSLFNPQQPHTCSSSTRTGQYSTLCYDDPWERQYKNSMYLLAMNPCSVPPSVALVAMFNDGHEFVQTFTESKLDEYVPVRSDDAGTKCGIMIQFHQHDLKYHVTVVRGCPGKGNESVNLIDDYYHGELGMMCPLDGCVSNSQLNHSCEATWISGHKKTKKVSIATQLKPCSEPLELDVTMKIDGQPITFHEALRSNHEEDWNDAGQLLPFHISTGLTEDDHRKEDTPNDGYLGLDRGNVTLYVHEDRLGFIHTVILRHYPTVDDFMPIMHDEFWVNRREMCPDLYKEHHGDHSMTVLAVVVVIGIIAIVVIVGFFMYRRRRLGKRAGAGLPYEIHLEDDFHDDY